MQRLVVFLIRSEFVRGVRSQAPVSGVLFSLQEEIFPNSEVLDTNLFGLQITSFIMH